MSRALFVPCDSPSSNQAPGIVIKHFAISLAGHLEFNSQINSRGKGILFFFFNILEFGNDMLCYK